MTSNKGLIALSLFALLTGSTRSAQAEGDQWQSHYARAEQAHARHDLFGARHEFLRALKQAEDCQQAPMLATKLETLAITYQSRQQQAEAEQLIKLARKLRAKLDIASTDCMPH